MTLLTLTRLPEFCGWVLKVFSKNLSETLSSALLCSIVVGWALVAIGQMKQILLFLLALPTLLLFAFIVGWTAPYLAAYLTLVATLAIATQERRIQPRIANHNGEFTVVLFRDRAG
jgi:glucose-6-phosphate-specific signal transduction histidine kinase